MPVTDSDELIRNVVTPLAEGMSDDKQYPPPPHLEVLYLISRCRVLDGERELVDPASVPQDDKDYDYLEDEGYDYRVHAPPLPGGEQGVLEGVFVPADRSDKVKNTYWDEHPVTVYDKDGEAVDEEYKVRKTESYEPVFQGKFSELEADGCKEYLLIRPKWEKEKGRWEASDLGVVGYVECFGIHEDIEVPGCPVYLRASQRRARVTGWERRDDPNRLDLATVEYLADSGADDETTVTRAYKLVQDAAELKFLSDHRPFVELADGDSADVDKRVRDAFRVQSVEELRSLGADGLWDIIRECIQRLDPSESYDTSDLRQLLLDSNDFADRIQQVQDLLTKAKQEWNLVDRNQYEIIFLPTGTLLPGETRKIELRMIKELKPEFAANRKLMDEYRENEKKDREAAEGDYDDFSVDPRLLELEPYEENYDPQWRRLRLGVSYVLLPPMSQEQLKSDIDMEKLYGVLGKAEDGSGGVIRVGFREVKFTASETRCRIKKHVDYRDDGVDNFHLATVELCDDQDLDSDKLQSAVSEVREKLNDIAQLRGQQDEAASPQSCTPDKHEISQAEVWQLATVAIERSGLWPKEKEEKRHKLLGEDTTQSRVDLLNKIVTEARERLQLGDESVSDGISQHGVLSSLLGLREKKQQLSEVAIRTINDILEKTAGGQSQSEESNKNLRRGRAIVDLPYFPQRGRRPINPESVKKELDKAIVTACTENLEEGTSIHGMERVKEDILDYLAGLLDEPESPPPVLCLTGPHGVGKTTIAKAIADALHRQFETIALGGLDDSIALRGLSYGFLGSEPGRIIQTMRRLAEVRRDAHRKEMERCRQQNKVPETNAQQGVASSLDLPYPSNDPVILLDEIDKMGAGHVRGDPAAVLLAALDPQQNERFIDDYLQMPYDLSNVMFIATANYVEDIPAPLRNRMDIIQLGEYTDADKVKIADKIIDNCRKEFDVEHFMPNDSPEERDIRKRAIDIIVEEYTKADPGVRELSRLLRRLARKVKRRIVEGEHLHSQKALEICTVTEENIRQDLPKPAPLGHSSGGKLLHDFHERKLDMDPMARVAVREVVDKINRPEKYSQSQFQHEIERGLLLTDLPWPPPNTSGTDAEATPASETPTEASPAEAAEPEVTPEPAVAGGEAEANKRSKAVNDLVNEITKELSSHTGLESVKKTIVEHMVAQHHTGRTSGKVVCLVGPPGVGKTSITDSVAKATGWEYSEREQPDGEGTQDEQRKAIKRKAIIGTVALGGEDFASSIRGDRLGPGKIIQAIRDVARKYRKTRDLAGSVPMNPVIVLDEIDKVKPAAMAALLEVLDPQQNHEFMDTYVELPYDLSKVLFIATANYRDNIPLPLLDRMRVIELDGYTDDQKIDIAMKHIITHVCAPLGLTKKEFSLCSDKREEVRAELKLIINGYTREAGVRQLRQKIEILAEKALYQIKQEGKRPVSIDKEYLREHLGEPILGNDSMSGGNRTGVAQGLIVNADREGNNVGGGLLVVEVSRLPGMGAIKATGQIQQVMRESMEVAVTYVKECAPDLADLNIGNMDRWDTHVHFPEGAVPKDGPSGGITIATALISAYTARIVPPQLAMTGELTLGGRVLNVGGIKAKLLAALREEMRTVIIPAGNEAEVHRWLSDDEQLEWLSDDEQLENKMCLCAPKEFRSQKNGSKMHVIPVQHMTEVVDVLRTLWSD